MYRIYLASSVMFCTIIQLKNPEQAINFLGFWSIVWLCLDGDDDSVREKKW